MATLDLTHRNYVRDLHTCPKCKVWMMNKFGGLFGLPMQKDAQSIGTEVICQRCGFERFISIFCNTCKSFDYPSKFSINKEKYLHNTHECSHQLTLRKARIAAWKIDQHHSEIHSSTMRVEISSELEKGKFIEYLAGITFEKVDALWQRHAWLDPESIDGAPNLDDDVVKELIEQMRRVKWKAISKD